ncbi:type I-F CRISPR-associated endoribonuclease Cas6/Csy4 [Vitreoscilla massiliensis]|uniref:Type I-F CRISPR-associated endoribonuclease Cas6/Csy4 n=1 Tax=Vitreoscilla massiliensis TaxID=1689272 RepID=A0ABY4DZB7_9NEIS|nr:type I-F CRISPR-associated endoribonuclease Cas6/Csy4 [Vitreoscilla massiliensis]UOO88883.1 type I-F CRISPR-associated endoribonuclease Cas6/Csy4 [Vitreoscilla massiliensis]
MKHYQELILLPQTEVPIYFIWSKVYMQLHLALTELQATLGEGKVGVAFPEYVFDAEAKMGRLGSKLRVFAADAALLQQLDLAQHLRRYADYVQMSDIRAVPETVRGQVSFARVQVKSGAERAARRLIRRHPELDYATELTRLQGLSAHSALPFIQLQSLSSEQPFRLFIAKTVQPQAQTGDFGTYGLSSVATVPDF